MMVNQSNTALVTRLANHTRQAVPESQWWSPPEYPILKQSYMNRNLFFFFFFDTYQWHILYSV